MPQIKLIISILIILFSFNSCKKDCKCQDPTNPECENYDPCYGKRKINTYFLVREGTGSFPPNPPECGENLPYDTLYGVWAEFEVPQGNTENCTYEWIIGTQVKTYSKKKFQLNFNDWLQQGNFNKPIPITLKIRRPLDGCNGVDDTLKVVTRNIYFLDDTASKKVYVGYFEHSPNTLDTLTYITTDVNYLFRGYLYEQGTTLLIGLPSSKNDTCINGGSVGYECLRGYKYGFTSFNNWPDEKRGYMTSVKTELVAHETFRITYGVSKAGYPNQYVFIGQRIY